MGSARKLWAHSDCVAPAFGYPGDTYVQLFESPEANAFLGVVSRIELNNDSCDRDKVAPLNVIGQLAEGRDGIDFNIKVNLAATDENLTNSPTNVMDISAAS